MNLHHQFTAIRNAYARYIEHSLSQRSRIGNNINLIIQYFVRNCTQTRSERDRSDRRLF